MKLKRYNITKLHSVYGNDLRNLSSVFKYREIELQDYPTEEIGKAGIQIISATLNG